MALGAATVSIAACKCKQYSAVDLADSEGEAYVLGDPS